MNYWTDRLIEGVEIWMFEEEKLEAIDRGEDHFEISGKYTKNGNPLIVRFQATGYIC